MSDVILDQLVLLVSTGAHSKLGKKLLGVLASYCSKRFTCSVSVNDNFWVIAVEESVDRCWVVALFTIEGEEIASTGVS